KRPRAAALAHFQEQLVLTRAQLQCDFRLVGRSGPVFVLRDELFAIEPDRERVIAAERNGQLAGAGAVNLAEEVNDCVVIVRPLKESEVIYLAILEFALAPDRFLAVFAGVLLRQVDFLLRRIHGVKATLAGVVEGADVVPFAQGRRSGLAG